jgi:uncharacterized DUF497 family protein
MAFEWNQGKSTANKEKHGIDFDTARILCSDDNRVEIHLPYPVEERWIIIGKTDNRLWTAVFTLRGSLIRIISARKSRKKEVDLYEEKNIRKE